MLNYKHRFYGTTKQLSFDVLKKGFSSKELDYISIAILFGSRAIGKAHSRSDYDFAIIAQEKPSDDWGVYSQVWSDVGLVFGLNEVDYDIIDLSRVTPEMKHSIKQGYKILKGDDDDISRILAKD